MKRLLWVLLGVAGAVLAASVSSFVAMLTFGLGVCQAFDDTGGPFPASDSPQGRVCGGSAQASALEDLAVWSIPAAGLLAVVLMLVMWRWGSHLGRSVAITGLFVVPFLPIVPLAVPSDACSSEHLQDPGWDCETES